jgi:hypothetical protein
MRYVPLAFVLVLTACSRSNPSGALADAIAPVSPPAEPGPGTGAPPPSASASGAAPDGHLPAAGTASATMKLLDAGQPPRRALRYTWNVAQKEQLVIELRTSASTEVAGAKQTDLPLPPVHIAIAIDPRSVSPDGTLEYAWHVTSASVEASSAMPSPVAEGMRAEVAAIEHLKGSARVSSRGVSLGIVVDADPATDAGTGQMVEQVRQTLRDVAAPLPDEEVGRGARWQKLSQLEAKETRITQTETFTLLTLQGEKGTLDDVLAQTAPPQALRGPGMPQGTTARMDSMLASGDAKVRFDLSRVVPQTKFDGTTTMVVSGQAADEKKRVTMIMRVGIGIEGTIR